MSKSPGEETFALRRLTFRQSLPTAYPKSYVWIAVLGALDVMLTWVTLESGGRELNPLANVLLEWGGIFGIAALKTVAVVSAMLVCEYVGRQHRFKGLALVRLAIIISCLPVLVALTQLVAAYN